MSALNEKKTGWTAILRGLVRLIVIILGFMPLALDLWTDRVLASSRTGGFKNRAKLFFARRIARKRPADIQDEQKRRAVALRLTLIKLGPTFIKVGQALSTRPDLVPVAYLMELEKLQDQVPPFSNRRAMRTIQKDLKKKLSTVFPEIESSPIASASLGQVYRARLPEGTWVAVKVQRPGLQRLLRKDFSALRLLARFAERRRDIGFGINWTDAVEDFASMLSMEIDYRREVKNAEMFRKNFAGWRSVHVPRIYNDLCGGKTITMEFIEGVKLNDVEGLRAMKVDPMEVVERMTRCYLKQLIEDGFFHADPHPGNLRLMQDQRLAFFDFGMVGRLEMNQRSRFLDVLIHIAERDIHGIAQDLSLLGFLRPGRNAVEFQPAVEEILNRYLGKKPGRIRFHEIVYALSEIIYKYPFTIPFQFTFILRALLTLEGIGIRFDEEFSFFKAIKPHALEFLFFREAKDVVRRIFSVFTQDDVEAFSWERTKKLAGMFYRQVRKSLETPSLAVSQFQIEAPANPEGPADSAESNDSLDLSDRQTMPERND